MVLVVARLLATLNGYELQARQTDEYRTVMRVAADALEEPDLTV